MTPKEMPKPPPEEEEEEEAQKDYTFGYDYDATSKGAVDAALLALGDKNYDEVRSRLQSLLPTSD